MRSMDTTTAQTTKATHGVIPGARGACVTCGMGYRTVRKVNGLKDFAHTWELRKA